MALTVDDLRRDPEYAAAESEYAAAKVVNASDELALLRAENQWIRREQELRQAIITKASQAERRAAVVTEVKEKYPFVPESLYASIEDPEQLLKVAADLDEQFSGAVRSATNNWGPTTGPPADGTGRRTRANQERAELVTKANTGDPQALRAFRNAVWGERVSNSPYLSANRNKAAK